MTTTDTTAADNAKPTATIAVQVELDLTGLPGLCVAPDHSPAEVAAQIVPIPTGASLVRIASSAHDLLTQQRAAAIRAIEQERE